MTSTPSVKSPSVWRLLAAGGVQIGSMFLLLMIMGILMAALATAFGSTAQGIVGLGEILLGGGLIPVLLSVELARRVAHLSWRDMGWDGFPWKALALGVGYGLLVWAGIALLLWSTRSVTWQRAAWNAFATFMTALVLFPAAFAEEVLFRGFWLTLLCLRLPPFWAVLVQAVLFSLAHFANPHWGLAAALGIFWAGWVLAFFRLRYRGLAAATSFHWMWNVAQGVLLGLPVSGLNFPAPWQAQLHGPAWWTGGAFGPEAGVAAWLPLFLVMGLWWRHVFPPTRPEKG